MGGLTTIFKLFTIFFSNFLFGSSTNKLNETISSLIQLLCYKMKSLNISDKIYKSKDSKDHSELIPKISPDVMKILGLSTVIQILIVWGNSGCSEFL